jgi:hypothetical protein
VPVDPPVSDPPVPVEPPLLVPPEPVEVPPVPVEPPVLLLPPAPVGLLGAVLLQAAAVNKRAVVDAKRIDFIRGPSGELLLSLAVSL